MVTVSAITSHAVARALVLVALVVGVPACGRADDRPLPNLGPDGVVIPAASLVTLTVTSGEWSRRPVAGATVQIGADRYLTDAAGRAVVPMSCQPASFSASGFLERRVACLSRTTSDGASPVTLWAVGDDTEREALRAFAFPGDRLARIDGKVLDIVGAVAERDAALAAWRAAAAYLDVVTAGGVNVTVRPNVETTWADTVVAPWSGPSDCIESASAAWAAVSGFCMGSYRGPAPPAVMSILRVAPHRLAETGVAVRAMLYDFGLRPHPLPGVMNLHAPADDVSLFESRALHMVLQRMLRSAHGVRWPDVEF